MAMAKAGGIFDVDQLVSLAQQSYDELSPALAAKYYEQAIEQKPDDANLWHSLGIMYVECGEAQQAHKAFLKSIQLSPNENESNYLYIGQQCEGVAARTAFEKGIQIMLCQLHALDTTTTTTTTNSSTGTSSSKNSENSRRKTLRAHISNVYVSLAELFMTDLCDEENAQNECEKHLRLALQFDDNNIEAFATFAQFKHCQANDTEAIRFFAIGIQKLYAMQFEEEEEDQDEQKEQLQPNANDDDDCKDNEERKMEAVEDKLDALNEEALSIDSCLMIIRIGIELEQYEPCMILLRALLNANDEIGEIYALGALCWYKLDNKPEAAVWLHNAQIILSMDDEDNAWNDDLKAVLEAVENEMDMNTLPDISKLNLEEQEEEEEDVDGDDQVDIDAFLRDAEEKRNADSDELEDDDLEEIQRKMMRTMTEEDIDLNDDDVIDID